MNDRFWWLSRFLVRHLWRPLELLGVNDPTSAAKNYKRKASVENKLINWVRLEKHMLIAGHTHRPSFPEIGDLPYFNDGSCIHPYGITSMEITDGHITLAEWSIKTKMDGTLFVDRGIIAGPESLLEYFRSI
jgi:UDP-2,3-diacylglucosamine pyrophosphatase LpxH